MWSWVCVQLRYQVERQSHPWDPYHMMQMACCCCCSLSQSFVSLSSNREQGGLAVDWSNLIRLVELGLSQTRWCYPSMYMYLTYLPFESSSDRKQGGLATDWSNLITLVGTGLSQARSCYTLMYMQPTLRVGEGGNKRSWITLYK